jgi:hypothetical protein
MNTIPDSVAVIVAEMREPENSGQFGPWEITAANIKSWAGRLAALTPSAPAAEDAVAKLQAFKDYVHQRLDAMGVPHSVPESEHDKAGCRVGGRLDFVEASHARVAELRREKEAVVVAAHGYMQELSAVKAERDWLRDALERILNCISHERHGAEGWREARRIAREALHDTEKRHNEN